MFRFRVVEFWFLKVLYCFEYSGVVEGDVYKYCECGGWNYVKLFLIIFYFVEKLIFRRYEIIFDICLLGLMFYYCSIVCFVSLV